MAELLATPTLKDVIRRSLPTSSASSRDAVREVSWMFQDIDTTLSLVASIPHLLNRFVRDLTEVGTQLGEKSTHDLSTSLFESLLEEVDFEALRQCRDVWAGQARELLERSPEVREKLEEGAIDIAARSMAAGINALARHINGKRTREAPLVRRLLEATWHRLDTDELDRAGAALTDRILNGELGLTRFFGRQLKRRLSRRRS